MEIGNFNPQAPQKRYKLNNLSANPKYYYETKKRNQKLPYII